VEVTQKVLAALVSGYFLALVILPLMLTFFDIFDRLGHDRFAEVASLLHIGGASPDWDADMENLVPWCGLPLAAVIFWLQRKQATKQFLLGCDKLLVTLSWIGIFVSAPIAWISFALAGDPFLFWFGPTAVCLLCSGFVFILSMGALLIAETVPWQITSNNPAAAQGKQSKPYIALARKIATTCLLIAAFGLSTSWSHGRNLECLLNVRVGVAHDLVVKALSERSDFADWLQNRKLTGEEHDDLTSDFAWLTAHNPERPNTEIAWAEVVTIRPVAPRIAKESFWHIDPGILFRVDVREAGTSGAWGAFTLIDFRTRKAEPTAASKAAVRAGFEPKSSFAETYLAVKNAVLKRDIQIPSSGVTFPIEHMSFVVFIAVLACLVVLSDRITKILSDPESGGDEPWLLLDADTLAGRAIAFFWAVSLFCSPWLLISAYIWLTALSVRAEGSITFPMHDLLTACSLIVMIGVTVWLSREALAKLVAAYQLRTKQTGAHPPWQVFGKASAAAAIFSGKEGTSRE
jgi:hypothetical protein